MTSQISSIETLNTKTAATAASSKTLSSPKFNIDYVIKEFVREYYTIMIDAPEKLHCFYENQSSVLHCDEGDLKSSVVMGMDDIKSHIARQSYAGVSVSISHYDGQFSMNDGIMVFVLGYMTFKGEKKYRFAQTFLLSETSSGYFVINDIRRLLNGSDLRNNVDKFSVKPTFMKKEEEPIKTTIVTTITPTFKEEEAKPVKKTIPVVVIKKKEEASVTPAAVAINIAAVPKKKEENDIVQEVAPTIVGAPKITSWANMASNSASPAKVVVMKSEEKSASPSISTISTSDDSSKKSKGKKISDKVIRKKKENHLHSVYVSKVPSLYSQVNGNGRAEVISLFKKWGDLQNVEFVRNGVMFVEYVTRESCLAALNASDKGYYVLGEDKIPFKVDIRRTPEERKH